MHKTENKTAAAVILQQLHLIGFLMLSPSAQPDTPSGIPGPHPDSW